MKLKSIYVTNTYISIVYQYQLIHAKYEIPTYVQINKIFLHPNSIMWDILLFSECLHAPRFYPNIIKPQ